MREYQSPKKELSRPSRPASSITKSKKHQKIAEKSLNDCLFTSVCEDVQPDQSSQTEESNFSPISDISEVDRSGGDTECFTPVLSPALSASSRTLRFSDLASSFDQLTTEKDESAKEISDSSKIISLDELIRKAKIQVSDSESKKLLDRLVEMIIKELQPEEKDRFTDLLLAKSRVLSVFFMLCLLAMVMILFFSSEPRSSFNKPPPT